MSEKQMLYCKQYVDDQCTHVDANNLFSIIKYGNMALEATYRSIVQNRYFAAGVRQPGQLIENALRNWYNERDFLEPPYVLFDHTVLSNIIRVSGENNFTHLSSPETAFFGCAYNRLLINFWFLFSVFAFFYKSVYLQ